MNVKPCVQCGFCCKQRLCTYGKEKVKRKTFLAHCEYLKIKIFYRHNKPPLTTLIFRCSIWEKIQEMEKDSKFPMCGSGCSNTLYNPTREQAIQAIKEMAVERLTK